MKKSETNLSLKLSYRYLSQENWRHFKPCAYGEKEVYGTYNLVGTVHSNYEKYRIICRPIVGIVGQCLFLKPSRRYRTCFLKIDQLISAVNNCDFLMLSYQRGIHHLVE